MRYWSLLFLLTALISTAVFAYAPLNPDLWLPRNASTLGREVDRQFLIILWITGAVFVGTQLALAYAVWNGASREGRRAVYSHGNPIIELIWTLIPALILAFIALSQMKAWADIKFQSRMPADRPLAEVTARQFQWMVRYPGKDGAAGTPDDVLTVNDLRFVKNKPVLIFLRSRDVVHSFFLPSMRIKQDAVPGLSIPVWFDADQAGTYELVCAELCGWGHGKMRGVVTVYDDQEQFDRWLSSAAKAQGLAEVPAPPDSGSNGTEPQPIERIEVTP